MELSCVEWLKDKVWKRDPVVTDKQKNQDPYERSRDGYTKLIQSFNHQVNTARNAKIAEVDEDLNTILYKLKAVSGRLRSKELQDSNDSSKFFLAQYCSFNDLKNELHEKK